MNLIRKIWTNLLSLPAWQLAAVIFATSFILRLAFVLSLHTYRDLERYELERTAISLATEGVYGNPYALPTGPTAHVSPGYPLILAAIFRLFGTGIPGEIVKQALACAVTSAQYALIPLAAEVLGLGRSVGLLAAIVCVVFPAKPLVQMDGDWETPYTALFLILLSIAATRAWSAHAQSLRSALQRGFLWGLALLFASVLLPLLFCYIIAGGWFQRHSLPQHIKLAAVELAIAFLCLSPWIIRNYIVLGQPIVTRSNLGLELRVSNNDYATPDQRENYIKGVYSRYHPLQNRAEAEKVKELGEVAYNRLAQQEANAWITSHPRQYADLTLGRVWKFWFYNDPTSRIKTIFLDLTGFLGLIGALYLLVTKPLPGTAVALILLLYPAPSYLIHVGLRQRYPIDWLLTLLAVFASFLLWTRIAGLWQDRKL